MGRRGARMGDYADATGDGRPSPGESDTAAEGVWSSRDGAEEKDLGPEGVPGAALKSRLLGPGGGARRQYAWDSRVRLGTLGAGRGTPGSLGLGWETWALGSPGMKKGIQDRSWQRQDVMRKGRPPGSDRCQRGASTPAGPAASSFAPAAASRVAPSVRTECWVSRDRGQMQSLA